MSATEGFIIPLEDSFWEGGEWEPYLCGFSRKLAPKVEVAFRSDMFRVQNLAPERRA